MSDRYTRLFQLDAPYYQVGAPIIIAAGALLKDEVKNSVLAQVKFKSIANTPIKAIKASLEPLSTTGELIGEPIEHQYLDLRVNRDNEFGQKEPVWLPDINTRQFSVRVIEVAYEDNSVWQGSEESWQKLDSPESLDTIFKGDKELIKQYRLECGEKGIVLPSQSLGLWYCNCGSVNKADEAACHLCGNLKNELFDLDISALSERKDDRLKNEAYESAMSLYKKGDLESLKEGREIIGGLSGWRGADEKAQEFDRQIEQLISKAKADKKKKKTLFTGMAAAAVIIGLIVVLVIKVFIPNSQYKAAEALMDSGDYQEAHSKYEKLGTYKDSESKAEEAKRGMYYEEGMTDLKQEKYDSAVDNLTKAEDFGDAKSKLSEAQSLLEEEENEKRYQRALDILYTNGQGAYDLLTEVGDYKDAKEYLEGFEYKIIDECTTFMGNKETNETQYLYENGKLIKELYLLSSFDNKGYKEYTYDSNGQLEKTYELHAASKTGSEITHVEYMTLYKDGHPSHQEKYTEGKSEPFETNDYSYTFYPDGAIETITINTVTTREKRKVVETYNENGLEIQAVTDILEGSDTGQHIATFEYDSYDNLTGITYEKDGEVTRQLDYHYDYELNADGTIKKVTGVSEVGPFESIYEDGLPVESTRFKADGDVANYKTYEYELMYVGNKG